MKLLSAEPGPLPSSSKSALPTQAGSGSPEPHSELLPIVSFPREAEGTEPGNFCVPSRGSLSPAIQEGAVPVRPPSPPT